MNNTHYKNSSAYSFTSEIDKLIHFYSKEVVEFINEKNRKSSYLFNLLRNFDIGETKHSLIIAKLLDPNGDHGQGILFLKLFLSKIGIKVSKNDHWSVTFEIGRIDILIKRKNPPAVIVIENKSNDAIDQDNQLYRYWLQEIFLPNKNLKYNEILKNENYKLIYLSRNNNKKPKPKSLLKPNWDYLAKYDLPNELNEPEHITHLTFEKDIINWLTECLACLTENSRLSEFVSLYYGLINEFSNSKIMENEKTNKIIAYFESSEKYNGTEKWNFFTELSDLKGHIIEKWYTTLYNGLQNRIIHSDSWKSVCWADGIKWYLKEFEGDSISIWLQKEDISLWVSPGYFDIAKIKDKLNNDLKYQPILGLIKEDKFYGGGYLATEKGRYAFGNINDYNFNADQLAWFAGNKTDELIKQIELKLKPFFDEEITYLIAELIKLGKK